MINNNIDTDLTVIHVRNQSNEAPLQAEILEGDILRAEWEMQ